MFKPAKVVDIELSLPLQDIKGLERYAVLRALIRWNGSPIGYVTLPLSEGFCSATTISRAVFDRHSHAIVRHLLYNRLAAPLPPDGLHLENLVRSSPPQYRGEWPLVTVAVCTRDRTSSLDRCLNSLSCLDYPTLDFLVIDNAPDTSATERLVSKQYPHMRYVCEPRPGLDWARNRAISEARGEIIAFTDDDAVVDPGWISALTSTFSENPEVMAVTGLVVPSELETEPQQFFEQYGGFGQGFQRRWHQRTQRNSEMSHLRSGRFGTGANMAYRRSLFDHVGGFDPALDVGTVTNGGGDIEFFFRVLQENHTLVYEPGAVVRHCHRREYSELETQITNFGVGFYSHLVRSASHYPSERAAIIKFGLQHLWRRNILRLLLSLIFPPRFPRNLILNELRGSFIGVVRYKRARRVASEIARTFGPLDRVMTCELGTSEKGTLERRRAANGKPANGLGGSDNVRTVDLSKPLNAVTDASEFETVHIAIALHGRFLGSVSIANHRHPISAARLRDAIADWLAPQLLEPKRKISQDALWEHTLADLIQPDASARALLPVSVPVSVVVGSRARPDELRNCLRCLRTQDTTRRIEIIIVGSNMSSSLTDSVVTECEDVTMLNEQWGTVHALNAGILASTGDVVIIIDEDVTMPPFWLEKLVMPFARSDVMAVIGDALPREGNSGYSLDTDVGLGRRLESSEVKGDYWAGFRYSDVPAESAGKASNLAFRTAVFSNPEVGMFEALSSGMRSNGCEYTYLFYKILRASYTVILEPEAYVWHNPAGGVASLRRQAYLHGKGVVAYNLVTLLRHRDLRSLKQLAIRIPASYVQRIKEWLRGRRTLPLSLIVFEITGNLAGPWSLWRSFCGARHKGPRTL